MWAPMQRSETTAYDSSRWKTPRVRTGVTLRVHGVEAGHVERVLGISSSPRSRSDAPWLLVAPPRDGVELEESIVALLEMVEPRASQLAELRTLGAQVDLFCYVGSHATEHAAILAPSTWMRVAALDAELWLDIYEEGSSETWLGTVSKRREGAPWLAAAR